MHGVLRKSPQNPSGLGNFFWSGYYLVYDPKHKIHVPRENQLPGYICPYLWSVDLVRLLDIIPITQWQYLPILTF